MRRLIATLSVLLALSGASVALALPASATTTGLCGSGSKLWAGTPYTEPSLIGHYTSTRGYLTCGPFRGNHQWKVNVQLQQYYHGAWHAVASVTSAWRTAKSGTVGTNVASVYCLGSAGYKFRARATGYYRSSSTQPTSTLASTYSATVTRAC